MKRCLSKPASFLSVLMLLAIAEAVLGDIPFQVFGADDIPTVRLGPNGEIRSISGEFEDSDQYFPEETSNDRNRDQVDEHSEIFPDLDHSWVHHVDFDELHPGEDSEAVESRASTREPMEPPPRNNRPEFTDDYEMPAPPRRPRPQTSRRPQTTNANRNIFPSLPSLSFPGLFNPGTGMMDENPIFSPFFGGNPWWKGPNVCQKRSEEDGTTEGNQDAEIERTGNEPEDEPPGFHMKFSACEEKETRHSCVTHLLGPNVNRTIRTEYECCHGYLRNSVTQKCERGTLESILYTLRDVGGKEFKRLLQNVGLDYKVDKENLTVFVPTDDAIATYMTSKRIDSRENEVTLSLAERDRETIRRRRSVLLHETGNTEESSSRVRRRTQSGNSGRRATVTREREELDADMNSIGKHDWRTNALNRQDAWRRAHGNQITYSHSDNNRDLLKTLLGHMLQGKLSTDDFVDEQVLYTENKEGVVRLNSWNVEQGKLKTVNCARLTSVNHQCSNGMIHIIDRMVEPATKSMADIIVSNPDLSMLKTFLSTSGLLPMLRDSKQNLTLFAPTNAALNKLGSGLLLKMTNGDPCLPRIMKHHLLPITLCSTVIFQKGQVRNLNEVILGIERSADDKLFVNGTQILTRDIITTNGVIHIVDGVLMSEEEKPLESALERAQLTSFLELLSQVGLKSSLDGMKNVTLFAPSNEAIAALPEEVRNDPARLLEVVSYHIATPETRACHFTHGQDLSTRLTGSSIRINLYSMFPAQMEAEVTAQCGRILKHTTACNGIIYELDRVLIPSDMDVVQTLQTQPDLSVFNRLIQETNFTGILEAQGPMTIFAPTDAAFYALPREKFERILNNRVESLKIVKKHIVAKESLCCAGIPSNMWFLTKRAETLSGVRVPVYRDVKGQVMFGNAKVTVCDLTTSNNGVIHTIDSLLDTERDEDIENSNEFMGTCLPRAADVRMIFF